MASLPGDGAPRCLAWKVVALEFESRLARKIVRGDRSNKGWPACLGVVLAIFLVINFVSGSLGASNAVIHIGTKNSVAKYMGQFDGKANVLMLGTISAEDWICVKVPFKGRLSDVVSISFSDFIYRPGGDDPLEPYVVIRMSEGRNLVCHPPSSYGSEDWYLPVSEWQPRDTVAKGKWSAAPVEEGSPVMTFREWQNSLGNANVLSVSVYVGAWETASSYVCYVGDLTINGQSIGLSNAARCAGPNEAMPAGF